MHLEGVFEGQVSTFLGFTVDPRHLLREAVTGIEPASLLAEPAAQHGATQWIRAMVF